MLASETLIADSPERSALCAAMLRAPIGWLDLESVVRRSSLDREVALDTLADLHLSGWIHLEEMEGHDAPVLSLSPYGAACLGVVVYESGQLFRWRARSVSARGDRVRREPHVTGFPHEDFEDQIPDEQPPPLDALVISERPMQPDPYPDLDAPRDPPYPGVILGLRIPWPVKRRLGEVCQGCGSILLPLSHYCAACDAWGREMPPKKRQSKEENQMVCMSLPSEAGRPPAAEEAAA